MTRKPTTRLTEEFYSDVVKGHVPGHEIINKFGYNGAVGTNITPITSSGTFQTPMADTQVEIVSDDANDVYGGTGLWSVEVSGINIAGECIDEVVNLAGLTPVVLQNSFFRVYRMKANWSGTYASDAGSSHDSTITVQTIGAGVVWGKIETAAGFGLAQSQIGIYTVPGGKTAYLLSAGAVIESTKSVDLFLFRRNNAHIVVPPYGTMKLLQEFHGTGNSINLTPPAPINELYEFTDVGIMGRTDLTTSAITINMQLMLVDNYG